MGFLSKLVGRKTAGVAEAAKKLENRDLCEASVGGCLLMGYVNDGSISEQELQKTRDILTTNPRLEVFAAEIPEMINKMTARLNKAFRLGRQEILDEIADVKGDVSDKRQVILAMIEMAEAGAEEGSDSAISPAEMKELTTVANLLGVDLQSLLN